MNNNTEKMLLAGGAAGTVILPQTLSPALAGVLSNVAPLAANTLPYCTGVCGACGGTCIGSVAVVAWLALAAKLHHQHLQPATAKEVSL